MPRRNNVGGSSFSSSNDPVFVGAPILFGKSVSLKEQHGRKAAYKERKDIPKHSQPSARRIHRAIERLSSDLCRRVHGIVTQCFNETYRYLVPVYIFPSHGCVVVVALSILHTKSYGEIFRRAI